MESFHVICETCRARLKVRSESAVGEIHACPKCGSMVHVALPAGIAATPPELVDPSSIQVAAPASAITVAAEPAFTFIDTSTPSMPPVGSNSSFVIWGVAGAAILVGGGLAAMMLRGGTEPAARSAPAAATRPATTGNGIAVDETNESASTIEPLTQAAPEAVEPIADSAEVPDTTAVPPSIPELPPGDAAPTSGASDTPVAANAEPLPPPTASESPQPAAQVADEQPRPAVMKFDPLDFDPSQLSLHTSEPSPNTPAPSSIPDNPNGEAASAAGDLEIEPGADVPIALPAPDRSITVRLGPIPGGAATPDRVSEQLATQVESMDVDDIPLARFVALLSGLADMPITIDPVALELAGVSCQQSVSAKGSNVTIEKLLRDALAKQRLDFVERDGQVILTLAGADRGRGVEYEVADLIGIGDGKQLIETIKHFVAPATWQGGNGSMEAVGTKLRIEHTQSVRHEALIFSERLRLARGLGLRSRYPASLLTVESPYKTLAPKLGQRTTFTFLPWTRLDDVLRHWQESSGLTILADWSTLAEADLGPSTPVSCSAIDRTWEETLDGILAPLDLGWWAVNGETIAITGRDTLDAIRRIEFYTVPQNLRGQFASNDALIDALEKEFAETPAGSRTRLSQTRMELDAPSGRLIVLGSPEMHRYLNDRLNSAAK